jgi:hypothetical protein
MGKIAAGYLGLNGQRLRLLSGTAAGVPATGIRVITDSD